MKEQQEHIQLGQAVEYEIQVQGIITQHWLGHFSSLSITVEGADGWAVTTLRGQVMDQADLQGLLQKLYTLGLVLLKVERKEK